MENNQKEAMENEGNVNFVTTEAKSTDQKVVEEQKAVEPPVKKELTPEEIAKLNKQRTMLRNLQVGAYTMKFIFQDINKQQKDTMNRHQRRRFQKELSKGVMSEELIQFYITNFEQALEYTENLLKLKVEETKDGPTVYAEMKKEVADNEAT